MEDSPRGSSSLGRPHRIVMNGQQTLGVFLPPTDTRSPPGAGMYELRVMYAQARGNAHQGAGLPGKGKALMWASLGARMSCVGAAKLVGAASAAPEVGLSQGNAPPFPAIS